MRYGFNGESCQGDTISQVEYQATPTSRAIRPGLQPVHDQLSRMDDVIMDGSYRCDITSLCNDSPSDPRLASIPHLGTLTRKQLPAFKQNALHNSFESLIDVRVDRANVKGNCAYNDMSSKLCTSGEFAVGDNAVSDVTQYGGTWHQSPNTLGERDTIGYQYYKSTMPVYHDKSAKQSNSYIQYNTQSRSTFNQSVPSANRVNDYVQSSMDNLRQENGLTYPSLSANDGFTRCTLSEQAHEPPITNIGETATKEDLNVANSLSETSAVSSTAVMNKYSKCSKQDGRHFVGDVEHEIFYNDSCMFANGRSVQQQQQLQQQQQQQQQQLQVKMLHNPNSDQDLDSAVQIQRNKCRYIIPDLPVKFDESTNSYDECIESEDQTVLQNTNERYLQSKSCVPGLANRNIKVTSSINHFTGEVYSLYNL